MIPSTSENSNIKRCTKCGALRSLDQFTQSSTRKSGTLSWCLGCYREKNRKWYQLHKEERSENAKDYYRQNREYFREYNKTYRRKTYKKISQEEWAKRKAATKIRTRASNLENNRRWRSDNRDKYNEQVRVRAATWRAKWLEPERQKKQLAELERDLENIRRNGVCRKKSHRVICPILKEVPELYKAAKKDLKRQIDARRSPELKRQSVIAWKKANPAQVSTQRYRRRTNLKNVRADLTESQWDAIKATYGHRCAYCRQRKPLTQDHVIPVSKGGDHTASNIVPACQSCNSRKGARLPVVSFQQHLIA